MITRKFKLFLQYALFAGVLLPVALMLLIALFLEWVFDDS